ncbi:MAG: HAD-IIIA family hydrolase [Bacteroidota bacterium]|nr:HAD-IIIA family hydrolase [Flavisolibacter sp.]MBD0288321.1 HAD-IIIA family hydrolase [Flavisolibacter sp.]MBD0350354.1 HAD-IIIA family hydrolase [Flavisolibacter sp.]MBD0368961.1 HAD-IIIA family hydrolase [Flavisolibacter sp.]MDQ3842786.1 HAD-IIIA family hydrolase [Bacteroidota bacterium]
MNVLTQFKQINTFVFDVDGVLTDGRVLLLENGLQARQMHVKDGLALQIALKNGYRVLIISGGYSAPVVQRMHYLGVQEVYLAIKNKFSFLENYLNEHKIDWQQVLFVGDDLPDIPVLQKAGMSCCPADAVPEVKKICTYISTINGGYGCVREVIEKVLKLNDHWHHIEEVSSR